MDIGGSIRVWCRSAHESMDSGQEIFTLLWRWHRFCLGPYPTGACPEFHVSCRLVMGCDQKALSYSKCGCDTSPSPIPYPTAACPEFHVGQSENVSPCPYIYLSTFEYVIMNLSHPLEAWCIKRVLRETTLMGSKMEKKFSGSVCVYKWSDSQHWE